MSRRIRFLVIAGMTCLLICAPGCGKGKGPGNDGDATEPGPLPEGWAICTFDGGFSVHLPGEAQVSAFKLTGAMGEYTVNVRWVPPPEPHKLIFEVLWYDVTADDRAKFDVQTRMEKLKDFCFPKGKEVRYKHKPFTLRGLNGTDYEAIVPGENVVTHMRMLSVPHGDVTRILCLRIRGPGYFVDKEEQKQFFNSLRVP